MPATIPHPGRFNNSWEWLRTVNDAMREAGEPVFLRASMMDRCEKAYLSGGTDACIEAVRAYVTIEERAR